MLKFLRPYINMCGKCHEGISNESIISQLREILENPRFEVWNTTSLGHVLLVLEGRNGRQAMHLASEVVERFYEWYLGPTWGLWQLFFVHRGHGYIPFPSVAEVRAAIDRAREKGGVVCRVNALAS